MLSQDHVLEDMQQHLSLRVVYHQYIHHHSKQEHQTFQHNVLQGDYMNHQHIQREVYMPYLQ